MAYGSAMLTTRHSLYPQKLPLTLPISVGRSVGIVRSWTKAMELLLLSCYYLQMKWLILF
jgi:hypothetical protein